MSASLAGKSNVSSKVFSSSSKKMSSRKVSITTRATGSMVDDKTGIKKMRDGIKEAADENLLTPRFYTTGTSTLLRCVPFVVIAFDLVSFLLRLRRVEWVGCRTREKDIFSNGIKMERNTQQGGGRIVFFLLPSSCSSSSSKRERERDKKTTNADRTKRETDATISPCSLTCMRDRFRRDGTTLFEGNQPESRRVGDLFHFERIQRRFQPKAFRPQR